MKQQHVQQEQEVQLTPAMVMQAMARGMLKPDLCQTKIMIKGGDLFIEVATKKGVRGASFNIDDDLKKYMKEMIIKGLDAEKNVLLFVVGRLAVGFQLTQATALFCVISDHLDGGCVSHDFATPFNFTTWSDEVSKEDAKKLAIQN